MAELVKVAPNRMELLKNKRRLTLAKRGHKLLKDKYDELIRRFLILIRENKELRASVEEQMRALYVEFTLLRAEQPIDDLAAILELVPLQLSLTATSTKILNTKVPVLEAQIEYKKKHLASGASLAFERFIPRLNETMELLVKLAQHEQTIRLLAAEIERTRRRVNALEHILIPSLSSNLRFITLKMDEIDRENRTRLMKTKELLLQEAS